MPARKGRGAQDRAPRAPRRRERVPASPGSAPEEPIAPARRERPTAAGPKTPMGTPDLGSLAEGITPVLPVRQSVLFPFVILPLTVGRPGSVQLVNDVVAGDRTLAVFAQRDPSVEDPAPSDLHQIGTLATVLRLVRMPDEQLAIVVQGLTRVRLVEPVKLEPYLKARLAPVAEIETPGMETEAMSKNLLSVFERIVALSPQLPDEALTAARHQGSPARLADFIASLLDLPVPDKQRLLEIADVRERLEALQAILVHHQQVLELGQRLQESVRETLDERQKEFLLRQQLEAIRKELGEGEQEELVELRARIDKAQMPPDVRKEAERELGRLQRIPPQSPEYTVARTYLEWLCDMPWATTTEDQLDLQHVRQVLDEDHYGLDKIKERILEFLAVRRFKPDARTPILCFVGPPGTGKTSLGMSIARALGRRFVRMSLGGVRDEAEIRGHRRTYIGALPGNIIRGIRRAGSRNPLFMLDEIDKLGADFRGDPASALLEVLDPAQNHAFVDHYLDVPFDLSQVLFLTTANVLDPIPPALRDRMEVIELTGYTDREKLEIAKRHLIPKVIAENGLESLGIVITDEAIAKVESDYTSEAGLRWLERELANLLRRTAKQVAEGKDPPREIDPQRVRELLGPERFQDEKAPRIEQPGAALGLAWTPYGGEVLTVEATAMPGSKQLQLTGQLGEVMRESAYAALSYLRSHAQDLGVDPEFFERADLHIHLPAGAIAKDGPSAGITMCTALASVLTGRKVRSGIGMTGEITLLGRVLPVGGLKEKVLAAYRAGLKTVILPRENEKDLEEVPLEARTHIIFAPVDRMDQVLTLALEPAPEAVDADEPAGDGQDREEPGRPAPVAEPAVPRIGKPQS